MIFILFYFTIIVIILYYFYFKCLPHFILFFFFIWFLFYLVSFYNLWGLICFTVPLFHFSPFLSYSFYLAVFFKKKKKERKFSFFLHQHNLPSATLSYFVTSPRWFHALVLGFMRLSSYISFVSINGVWFSSSILGIPSRINTCNHPTWIINLSLFQHVFSAPGDHNIMQSLHFREIINTTN